MKTLTITGSHGILTVDANTGDVLTLVPFDNSTDYSGITRFDLAEWRSYWDAEPEGVALDILDVGFWDGGEYVEAEADWRAEVRQAREARRAIRGTPVVRAA